MKDALLKEKGTSEKRALTLPNGKRARVHKLEVKLFFIVSNKSRNRLEAQKCIHRMKEFFWFVKEIWGGGNSRFFKTVAMLDFVLGKSLFIYCLTLLWVTVNYNKQNKARTGPRSAARFKPEVRSRSKLTKCPEQEQLK